MALLADGTTVSQIMSDSAVVREIALADSDLPAGTAKWTTLLMQLSEPIPIELSTGGAYQRRFMSPGAFCLNPPGLVPAARWKGRRNVLVVELAPHLLRSEGLELQNSIHDPQTAHLLFALRGAADRAYVEAVCRALAIHVESKYTQSLRRFRGGLSPAVLARVTRFIDENIEHDLPVDRLAAVAGLSPDHFAKAFREATGDSPHRYLMKRKVVHAQSLLERERPIAEIAYTLGFADQSHLTNVFRRYAGTTPAKVRAFLQKLPENYKSAAAV